MTETVYSGPVVFIADPITMSVMRDAKNYWLKSREYREQQKHHMKKLEKLLRFAKKHGLPVIYQPLDASKTDEFYRLAERAGLRREEIIIISKLARHKNLNPSRVIFAGGYRGLCTSSAVDEAKERWPNAERVVLEGSYTVREPPAIREHIKSLESLLPGGPDKDVLRTKKLGRHLLNPAWPLKTARRQVHRR